MIVKENDKFIHYFKSAEIEMRSSHLNILLRIGS